MERYFSDALAGSQGFADAEIPAGKLLSKRCIGDYINSFMDICGINEKCIATVMPIEHKVDGSGYVFDLSFIVWLISEENDSHVSIGKDKIEFNITAHVGKRKKMTILGSFNGIEFQFKKTIDCNFYKPLAYEICMFDKDGKRFKVEGSRANYESDNVYVRSFNEDIEDAKKFVNGDEKKDTGSKKPKRKIGGVY